LLFTVEKQGHFCKLGILFLKTTFEWMSHFELLIVCETFEYFLNEVLSKILIKRENL